VLAAFSALLTAVGHLAGGGTLPDLSLLVVLLPLLAAVFVSLAERARSLQGMLAVLAGGQLALHETMVLLHPMDAPAGPFMLGTHAAVTLLTGIALRHADAAVAAVVAAVRRAVPRRPAPQPADRPLATRPVPAPDLPARLARVAAVAVTRRGPPVWC
jgi:hypothetical protein